MSNPVVVHSKLSFSGRERWRACPISVHMSAGMPDKSGPAAAEGTSAHTVAEFYVRQHFVLPGGAPAGAEAPDMPVPEGVALGARTAAEWNAELRTHGKAYRDFIVSLIPPGEPAFVAIERKVSIASISPHLFGTADCLIWMPRTKVLVVVDYKYGFMAVDVGTVEDTNAQLSAYAVAALDQCTLQADGGIKLAVFQPRRTFGKPSQVIELPPEWLARERMKLANEVAAVESPSGPRPGEHCKYCKGKSKCPTVHNALATAIQAHCGAADLLAIPDDDLITLYAARGAFKAFWEDVEERVEQMAKTGHKRLTVVEKQGRQMWRDPADAALTLMAVGRQDLLTPVALSEALPHLPEAWRESLIKRSAPSRSIQVVDEVSPNAIASAFEKYVDKSAK